MSHTLQHVLESGQETRIVQIDYSAASDRVSHQRILQTPCGYWRIFNNNLTFFCIRSSSNRTDLSMHFQPSRVTTIWFFSLLLRCLLVHSTTTQTTENVLSVVGTSLRLLKLKRPLHTGLECRFLASLRPELYHLHHRGDWSIQSRYGGWLSNKFVNVVSSGQVIVPSVHLWAFSILENKVTGFAKTPTSLVVPYSGVRVPEPWSRQG